MKFAAVSFAFFAFLMFATVHVVAQETPTVDPRVKSVLDTLGVKFEIDSDGDFRVVYDYADEKRSQLVIINSNTTDYDSLEMREIWSIAYKSKGPFTQEIANTLLKETFDAKIGGWQALEMEDGTWRAIYSVKLPADIDAWTFGKALDAVTEAADEMEKKLTGKDEY